VAAVVVPAPATDNENTPSLLVPVLSAPSVTQNTHRPADDPSGALGSLRGAINCADPVPSAPTLIGPPMPSHSARGHCVYWPVAAI
jgi:hypothetical protein